MAVSWDTNSSAQEETTQAVQRRLSSQAWTLEMMAWHCPAPTRKKGRKIKP
eukprot:CAMPEP_0172663450 /NCGR_PEP_ID=MMETSP1074-20121228/5937_1 /TAXON_ID=2916 /ORGANISM="Ceratium fusus, Strain PA161109" /LENGTH=50 /DNA_ID=CAMNT_0013479451 /DNA_START=60 /DNA_END=209 /DNA_ORIENTATION=+